MQITYQLWVYIRGSHPGEGSMYGLLELQAHGRDCPCCSSESSISLDMMCNQAVIRDLQAANDKWFNVPHPPCTSSLCFKLHCFPSVNHLLLYIDLLGSAWLLRFCFLCKNMFVKYYLRGTTTNPFSLPEKNKVGHTKYPLTASIRFKRVSCSQVLLIIISWSIHHQQVCRPP